MHEFFQFADNRRLPSRVKAISNYVQEIINAGNLVAHPKQRTAFAEDDRDFEIPEIIALENARRGLGLAFPQASEQRLTRLATLRGDLMIGQYAEWRPRARNRVIAMSKHMHEIIEAGNLAYPEQRTAYQECDWEFEIPDIIALENARRSNGLAFPLAERRLTRLSTLRGDLMVGNTTTCWSSYLQL